MYRWSPDKFLNTFQFPINGDMFSDEGCVYSTILPAGIYELNDGSRSEQFTPAEFQASKSYICDWNQRYYYIEVLRETVYNFENIHVEYNDDMHPDDITNVSHSYWNYYLPAYPQSISVTPFGAEGVGYDAVTLSTFSGDQVYSETNTQKYTKAKITVSYKGLARVSGAVMEQSIQPMVQYRKIPPFGFVWVSDGAMVLDKEAPGVQEIKLKITRSLNNVRQVPPAFFDLAGCVNDALVVDWLTGLSFPEGTLLYMPTNMQKTLTSAIGEDNRLWSFSFELNYNPIGWNRWRRPHGIDAMMFNGLPIQLYKHANFERLGLGDMVSAVEGQKAIDAEDGTKPTIYNQMYDTYFVLCQHWNGSVFAIKVHPNGYVEYLGNINGQVFGG